MTQLTDHYSHVYSIKDFLPAEYFVRMLRGKYPNLDLSLWASPGDSVLDASCGDGRHLKYLASLGYTPSGYEIDDTLVSIALNKCNLLDPSPVIRTGRSKAIPFDDNTFDGFITWNQLYYLDHIDDFPKHLEELFRVTKSNGWIIGSFPMHTCFIFDNCKYHTPNVAEITSDYFGGRNGQLMHVFRNQQDVYDQFIPFCSDIRIGLQSDNCFGLNYHWYLLAAQVK